MCDGYLHLLVETNTRRYTLKLRVRNTLQTDSVEEDFDCHGSNASPRLERASFQPNTPKQCTCGKAGIGIMFESSPDCGVPRRTSIFAKARNNKISRV
jgi:hypothetical protein